MQTGIYRMHSKALLCGAGDCIQHPVINHNGKEYGNEYTYIWLPGWHSGKESDCQCRRRKRQQFDPWVRKIPWRRKWQPTPIFLPGKFHRLRSLAGYSPWGHKESDITERPTLSLFLFSVLNELTAGVWSLWQFSEESKARRLLMTFSNVQIKPKSLKIQVLKNLKFEILGFYSFMTWSSEY